jgi:hypothetical protein
MAKSILSWFFSIFILAALTAQAKIILDTPVLADQLYLDPLNQIYLVHNSEKRVSKYSIHFEHLKTTSFRKGWDRALLDVSDPFKCLLYYPGDYKIYVLDESLATISAFEESELNSDSRICHFSTNIIGLYSNNYLKLKNYNQPWSISSDLLRIQGTNDYTFENKLKKSDQYLYLFISGKGIYRFTNQLFQDQFWVLPDIRFMDIRGDRIIMYKQGSIIEMDTRKKIEKELLPDVGELKCMAANSDYIILLLEGRLLVFMDQIR